MLEEAPAEVAPHAVLVGVSEPPEGRELARLGARIARALDSEVALLHVVAVPRQLPLRAGRAWISDARPMIDAARESAEELGVPVRTVVRLARRPADAIIRTTRERNVDYLLLGWAGPQPLARRPRHALIGATVDRVVKESNGHAIFYETHASRRESDGMPEAEQVLVPLSEPDQAPLALGIAASLLPIGSSEGRITILHLGENELSDDDRQAFRRAVVDEVCAEGEKDDADPAGLFGEDARVFFDFRPARRSVADAIVEASGDFDRMVLGTGIDRNLLGRDVLSQTSRQVVERSECPVVLVRPREGALKFGVQTFFQFFQELEGEEDTETGPAGNGVGGSDGEMEAAEAPHGETEAAEGPHEKGPEASRAPGGGRVTLNDGGGFLEDEGLFLPDGHRGELDLDRSEGSIGTLILGVGLMAACAVMAMGDGGTWTWVGSGTAMALFVAFGAMAGRSIERQSRRVHELTEDRIEQD